jgi:hypothetical protein
MSDGRPRSVFYFQESFPMPMTVNVGYSEKLGRPDYGSIGASCHIECELDGRLAFDDPEEFQTRVRELYASCTRAVHDELAQHLSTSTENATSPKRAARKPTNGAQSSSNGSTNHRASGRQVDFLQQLARQIPGVGTRKLESLAQRICGKPLAELSSLDASSLIDTLKAIKEGRLDVEAADQGAAR